MVQKLSTYLKYCYLSIAPYVIICQPFLLLSSRSPYVILWWLSIVSPTEPLYSLNTFLTSPETTIICKTKWKEPASYLREDINRKKNVFFRALPESPKPPPLISIQATWSSFFYVKNDVLGVWLEKKLMLIMKVAMIIMMIIMTKMTKKTYIYCEVWVKNAILRTITW